MKAGQMPGAEAREAKAWLGANRWLLARRVTQIGILLLFLVGPWFGWWIVKGNLSSSMTLDVLPLTDPLLLLQVLLSGHVPELVAFTGVAIVLAFYLLVGGRVYCSWVCPVNMVTDLAEWLRMRFNIKGGGHLSRRLRYWLLGLVLLLPLLTGALAWELINPVSLAHRGILFGMGLGWMVILGIFLLDLLIARRAWCGHLCPVGAFYGLIGRFSVLRVSADNRSACDDCMDCFAVCPEQQVIKPALKGAPKGLGPLIDDGLCTNCGRCIDVCAQDVFHFTHRFDNPVPAAVAGPTHRSEASP
ncbi:MAG: quinol dehydrogenase ferredoxin subunit NapH [Gammaproteobacteria bacterium]|nr:MAG: quinol dehydrogenase ferredoxin subunit NapH [Gammaproteobacteria bacterium]